MSEEMRDDFFEWYYQQEQFIDAHQEELWKAWQASRAALVVELPSQSDLSAITFLDYPIMDAGEIKASLDSAGVSYK